MINYSILDGSKTDINKNITVRLDDTEFKGSIITFDPITLVDENTLSYGIDINYLRFNDITKHDISLHDAVPKDKAEQFLKLTKDIFNDLLQLFKGDIKYDE